MRLMPYGECISFSWSTYCKVLRLVLLACQIARELRKNPSNHRCFLYILHLWHYLVLTTGDLFGLWISFVLHLDLVLLRWKAIAFLVPGDEDPIINFNVVMNKIFLFYHNFKEISGYCYVPFGSGWPRTRAEKDCERNQHK